MSNQNKLSIHWLSPDALVPYVKNAKIHTPEQIDKIAGQIAAFGFDQPIVVDKNNVIIKGHGRREAAMRLGMQSVPVIVSTLDEYQAMAARIADNKVAEAPWDPELLKFDLGTLKMHEFDMKLTGIEDFTLDHILDPPDATKVFENERMHQSVEERRDQYENTDVRQIILVTDAETFEDLMERFSTLQAEFQVETNVEVVQKLLEHYATHRSSTAGEE